MSDGSTETGADGEWSADELIPFGKYVLLDRLSSGATAAVYRANVRGEAGFERLVAIKRILPHMAGDRDFVDTFVREAKTVARLTHAAICPIYELGKVGESLYMAIEYIQGRDLGSIMRRLAERDETIPPVIAAWIGSRLCEALDYAHNLKNVKGDRKGIIHRDLSPSNVLISYEGQVKLIDFGLAKAVGRAQSTNVAALKLKISYMSPEMVKGRPLDGRSDLFGVAACLYEMITGRRLFVGQNDIESLKLVGNASVPPPSAVTDDTPEELELVLMKALERDPDDRYQEANDMGEALTAYLRKTDPTFGLQQLSDWMHGLFGSELAGEQGRIKGLLVASNDPEVLKQRKLFFSAPGGAAARARAEIERRMSTDPPVRRPHVSLPLPKAAPLPGEVAEPAPLDDPDKTKASPLAEQLAAGVFEDEPTKYYDGDKPFEPKVEAVEPAEEGGFEDEPTQFVVDGDDLEVVEDTGGFDEESTTIFFNKEEGVGVQEMLDEINDVERPGPLNRPIVAPELGLHAPAPAPLAYGSLPPGASSMPPARRSPLPVAPGVPRASIPSMTPVYPQPPSGPSAAVIVTGVVALLGIIGLLVWKTPVGTALGLRGPPSGSIELRTNPVGGATVYLDDVYRGTTPLRLEGVAVGTRRVALEVAGYAKVVRDVVIEPGGAALLDVALVPEAPAPPPVPPTASPLLPSGVVPGVGGALTAPGAALLAPSAALALAPSAEAPAPAPPPKRRPRRRVEGTLPPVAPPGTAPGLAAPAAPVGAGTLVINSVPWAYVTINGRDTGRTTPIMGYSVMPGEHEVQLRTATGQTHVQRVQVAAGQTVRIIRRF